MKTENESYRDKVSIIVPAYNVEQYIERCIHSLLTQTYDNIEIIVVDDHSTDRTFELLKNMEKNETRLKVYKNKKCGVSSARNFAIEKAVGKYIMFLDGDDEYKKEMVMNMYSAISMKNVQMAICNYTSVYNGEKKENSICFETGIVSLQEYLIKDAEYLHSIYFGAIWNKIYVSKLIKEKSIKFNEDISLGEDSLFNIEYFKYVEKIYIIEENLYKYYRNNQNSLTTNLKPIDTWENTIKIYDQYIKLYSTEQLTDLCGKDISYIILSNLIFPLEEIIRNRSFKYKIAKKKLEKIINNNVVRFALIHSEQVSLTDEIVKSGVKFNCYGMIYMLLLIKIRTQDKISKVRRR